MSAFQRFDWATIVNERIRKERASRFAVKTRYYLISRDGAPVLIAPLRVHLAPLSPGHRRGVHFEGRSGPADYLNMVYRHFDPTAARVAFEAVVDDFGIKQMHLERMLQDTDAFRWANKLASAKATLHAAIKLVLPENVDIYTRALSKSTRQNIRTGWNRARRDGIDIQVEVLYDITIGEAQDFAALKERREAHRKSGQPSTRSVRLLSFIRKAYFASLFTDYDEAQQAMARTSNPVIIRITADGVLAAFAFGLNDNFAGKRTLRLLQVGIDDKFSRYSPGFIGLHRFISQEIETGRSNWDVVDFTRGEERYKSQLGGSPHAYGDISLVWNKR